MYNTETIEQSKNIFEISEKRPKIWAKKCFLVRDPFKASNSRGESRLQEPGSQELKQPYFRYILHPARVRLDVREPRHRQIRGRFLTSVEIKWSNCNHGHWICSTIYILEIDGPAPAACGSSLLPNIKVPSKMPKSLRRYHTWYYNFSKNPLLDIHNLESWTPVLITPNIQGF